MEPDLELTRRDGAPEELWEIARLYWEHSGVNAYDKVVWVRPTKSISVTGWRGSVHHVAGAGAIAVLPEVNCAECSGPLTLTSRTAFESGRNGRDTVCCDCTPTYADSVLRVGGSGLEDLRLQQQQRAAKRLAAAQAEAESKAEQQRQLDALEAERRSALAAEYPLQYRQNLPDPRSIGLRARLTTLALMDYAARDGLVEAVEHQDLVLAPSPQQGADLIHEASGALLVTHPSTPTRAFAWASPAGGGQPNWTGYFPLLTRFHLGLGQHDPAQWENARENLVASVQLDALTAVEQQDLVTFAAELIGSEALRYLKFKLNDEYRLPDISNELRPRALDLLTFAARQLSLGHLMRAIWTVTSGATNLKASKPYIPKQRIADYTVSQLEVKLHDYLAPGHQLLDPYRADTRLPLSAIIRALYYEVVHADPLTYTLPELERSLPAPSDTYARELCRLSIPDGEQSRDALFAASRDWDGAQFRRALSEIENRTFEPCARGCIHDRQPDLARQFGASFDKLISRIGADAAGIALIESMHYSNDHPETPAERPGDLLLTLVAQELGVL